ncbi:MAG: multidrug effflux MFS transporter [Propionibacteriaceae bacterium]
MTTSPPSAPGRRRRLGEFVALGLLSTFGPISLDLYLPALPALADDLHTSTSLAQLSITFCLFGLASGQLLAGSLSDRYGRRKPLIIGLIGYLLASLACAAAPQIAVLLVLRLVQGVCGASGLVISRAIARDLHSGRAPVIFLSRLVLINGLAPVLAPVIGGQLVRVMSWRGIFVVLAGFAVVLLVAGLFGVPETLPPERRHERDGRSNVVRRDGRSNVVRRGGSGMLLHGFTGPLKDPAFIGTVLAAGAAGASMFAYISGSTFVLQRIFGLSPQGFSLAFAVNSIGIMAIGQLSGRLARRWPPSRLLGIGLGQNLVGALWLLVAIVTGLGLVAVLVGLFVMVSAIGMIFPSSAALAMANYPDRAGAASALVGLGQYVCGGIAAPLVGIAGQSTATPLGVVAAAASVIGMLVFLILVRRAGRPAVG